VVAAATCETGAARPPVLAGVRAVVFWLGDPLRELYPDCHAEACAIAAAAAERGAHLVNPPDALSNSVKSVQARIWRAAGIPTAAHTPFATRAELLAILATHAFPLIIRGDLLHAQASLHLCRTRADALAVPPSAIAYPGTVAEYVDTRQGFRERAPRTLFAELFHKKRAFVFGDVVRTNHVFCSEAPIVGLYSSTLARAWYGGRYHKYLAPLLAPIVTRLSAREKACLEADLRYFEEPPPPLHVDVLRRGAHALGQTFTAIDYAETADGGLVLWESNPHFDLPPWYQGHLAHARQLERRIGCYHDAIAAFFTQLLEQAAPRVAERASVGAELPA
jgi:hypothetical protein